jgi:hypothetical protein
MGEAPACRSLQGLAERDRADPGKTGGGQVSEFLGFDSAPSAKPRPYRLLDLNEQEATVELLSQPAKRLADEAATRNGPDMPTLES